MPQVKQQQKIVYLGIDPGASGGLATVGAVVEAVAMPQTERDTWRWIAIESGAPDSLPQHAVIEKVQGYIGTAHPGSGMFKFGCSYGGLRMALVAAGIPFEEVTPQAWQRAMGIAKRDKDESKTSFKNRLKSKAQQLFPSEKVTLKTADALLIAVYCQRKHEGTLAR